MFSGARNPTVLLGIPADVAGSQKFEMAASNLEMRISRLHGKHDINNILTAVSMLSGSSNPIWLLEILCDLTGSRKSEMAANKLDVPISQLADKSSFAVKRLYLCFRGRAVYYDYWGCCTTSPEVTNPKWCPLNWNYLLTNAEVYNVTWDDLTSAKWPLPPKICPFCTGKANKPYWA